MKIYYLKWSGTDRAPRGGAAYTDEKRAKNHAEFCNKNRSIIARLLGHQWVVSMLNLKGIKNV